MHQSLLTNLGCESEFAKLDNRIEYMEVQPQYRHLGRVNLNTDTKNIIQSNRYSLVESDDDKLIDLDGSGPGPLRRSLM